MNKKKCIVITGPTGIGKTAIAIELAKDYQTSIISADSRQCFNELTIGVAKPTQQQLQEVKHYFINSHSIHDNVTVADFETYSLDAATEIFSKNDIAVLAGGTGLYVKAFCEGLDHIPATDLAIRNAVITSYNENGITYLQKELQSRDPEFYSSADIHNPQRMMRALEVFLQTGKSIREFQQGEKASRSFDIIKIGLELPRELLNAQINQRVDNMIEEGLEQEALQLLPFRNLNALQTVGYKEMFDYFDKELSLEQAIASIKQHTRNYAKRQVTWFKKYNASYLYDPRQLGKIRDAVASQLQGIHTKNDS
ncbi:MAG: tRNA (adenosine(37)-N6)-dimethylallyltransferase MiaA [Chitinophagaceae bacterium]|nr:tRNA (adenosine(37)-N6)-dimethylallyltransferase MiaA [Chitinophagaceae bacterium]